MTFRDFSIMCAICVAWGLNSVVSRWAMTDLGAQPLTLAAARFLVLVIVLAPFLRRPPGQMGVIFLIAMGIGAAHFALFFAGLKTATAGAAAITAQVSMPLSTILSVVFLGETVRWRRGLGIVLSLAGIVMVAYNPDDMKASIGLLYVLGSATTYSIASILMKRIPSMHPLQLQAWVGAFSFLPLIIASVMFEPGAWRVLTGPDYRIWIAVMYAALVVSIFGHGLFYYLVQRYEITLISPLTLMSPVWSVLFGVWLLGEAFTPNMAIGSVVAFAGLLVIAVRPNAKFPWAALGRKFLQ